MDLLQPAINVGLTEFDFWSMTLIEVNRYIEGAEWRMRTKAQYDYALANLIGISVGRVMSNEIEFPPIEDVYTNLFEKPNEEEVKSKQEEIAITNSTNRFMEFALKHNAAMKQKGETNDD
jgi:hypothetical protein